jgi:hypothetical protein
MNNTGLCTTIALYELDPKSTDIQNVFRLIEDYFIRLEYHPLRGSAQGEGIKATQTWTYKYTKQLLEKRKFEGITGFWFGSYGEDHTDDLFDALLSVELETAERGFFCLYFHEEILAFDRERVQAILKEITYSVKSSYGIVYRRNITKGPGLYAQGVTTGLKNRIPADALEAKQIGEWWRRYFVNPDRYIPGQLRDIYPMNLLSEVHLSQPVFDTTLQKWIESSAEHGELKPLTDTFWEWWVPEEKIDDVREALRETGIIICI